MKRSMLVALGLIAALLGYCSLPLTSVATMTVALTDQAGRKITSGASATFLDAANAPITTIRQGEVGSWDNKLHWWTHSLHATSRQRPADAWRAVAVRVEAKGCDSHTIPVRLQRRYEPPSFAPHGGGPAQFIDTFEASVALSCR